MQNFPHHYTVTASGDADRGVTLESVRLPALPTAPPAEFGGPGDRWSPETLLVAAVADCFVLTFSVVARAFKVNWTGVTCEVRGTLDRVDHVTQFTEFAIQARLAVAAGTDEGLAHRALEKAERACLITNSLKAEIRFQAEVSAPELVGAPA